MSPTTKPVGMEGPASPGQALPCLNILSASLRSSSPSPTLLWTDTQTPIRMGSEEPIAHPVAGWLGSGPSSQPQPEFASSSWTASTLAPQGLVYRPNSWGLMHFPLACGVKRPSSFVLFLILTVDQRLDLEPLDSVSAPHRITCGVDQARGL